jgi:hypothetical protein
MESRAAIEGQRYASAQLEVNSIVKSQEGPHEAYVDDHWRW